MKSKIEVNHLPEDTSVPFSELLDGELFCDPGLLILHVKLAARTACWFGAADRQWTPEPNRRVYLVSAKVEWRVL